MPSHFLSETLPHRPPKLSIGVSAVIAGRDPLRAFRTEVAIAGPAERFPQVLADFDASPRWPPEQTGRRCYPHPRPEGLSSLRRCHGQMGDGMMSAQTTAQAGPPPAAAIVLVNADARERGGLAAHLERRYGAEYDVIAVGSGAAGLARLRSHRGSGCDVAIVLADHHLPGRDGVAVTATLRAAVPRSAVIHSLRDDAATRARTRAAGFAGTGEGGGGAAGDEPPRGRGGDHVDHAGAPRRTTGRTGQIAAAPQDRPRRLTRKSEARAQPKVVRPAAPAGRCVRGRRLP